MHINRSWKPRNDDIWEVLSTETVSRSYVLAGRQFTRIGTGTSCRDHDLLLIFHDCAVLYQPDLSSNVLRTGDCNNVDAHEEEKMREADGRLA